MIYVVYLIFRYIFYLVLFVDVARTVVLDITYDVEYPISMFSRVAFRP